MQVISSERKPIKMWLDKIEDGALEQAKNLANLPFIYRHVALMPDSHQGYGMPIGGVIATKKVIIPNAVGVDIGCGMCAVKTSLSNIDIDTLKKIMEAVRQVIPVGFNKHNKPQDEKLMPNSKNFLEIVDREYQNALLSLGTLGGGNHFIEIQKGNDGFIWIMIHSGSRNLGKQVADHYNKISVELNEKWFSSVPKEWQLAFLPLDSYEGYDYLNEMQYCVEYALANRRIMMNKIIECMYNVIGNKSFSFDDVINIAHNYAKMENHFGENVVVHRKGATLARKGTIGIIPGSQGTASYIVEGLGNKESFESCSHGAGRVMGRKEAQRTLDLKTEIEKLDNQGIVHGIRNKEDLDEASGAYKDINIVMENQNDLVTPIVELKPLAVIKG